MIKLKVLYRKYIMRDIGLDCSYINSGTCRYRLNGKCYKRSFELTCPYDPFLCGDEK